MAYVAVLSEVLPLRDHNYALLSTSDVKTVITTVVKFGFIDNKWNSKACFFTGPFASATLKLLGL